MRRGEGTEDPGGCLKSEELTFDKTLYLTPHPPSPDETMSFRYTDKLVSLFFLLK